MQLFVDYIPIVVFILAYFYEDIFFATAVLMAVMPVVLVLQWLLTKKILETDGPELAYRDRVPRQSVDWQQDHRAANAGQRCPAYCRPMGPLKPDLGNLLYYRRRCQFVCGV
jgi:hypothetical protein